MGLGFYFYNMKQIYVVEDDKDIRELLELLLRSQDYQVQSFPTAKDFKDKIFSEKPDLVLLDIMLPDGNGVEICKELTQKQTTKEIPVVLMSAHANPNISKEVGAKDFIAKPFNIDDFNERIKNQLS